MEATIHGAEDVPSIELSGRQKIERGGEKADPRSTADGIQQEHVGVDAGMNYGSKKTQQQGSAENYVGMSGVDDAGNDFGMQDAEKKRRNGKDKTDERAGSAHVEERACRANGGTDHDESAEGSDERRKGNEERVAGMNMMMAASEKMAELVREKNRQEGSREGHAGEKA